MRLRIALCLSGVLLAVGPADATLHGSQAGATASAYGIQVSVPGQAGASSTSVSAPKNSVGFASSFAYPSDGSAVSTGSITASASTDVGTNATSAASAQVSSLSLFGGEVTASTITGSAKGSTAGRSASGTLSGASISGLTVNGAAATASPNGRVALGDWGYATTLEQAEAHGAKGRAQTPEPVLPTAPGKTKQQSAAKTPKPPEPKRGQSPTLPPTVRPIPQGLQPKLTAGGYVFPVYGPSSFGDTFGAFRGDVPGNWHHGDDIFAPLGAPVLACADGTVFSVGWNDVGGNRLWLRDGQGNEFYYAQLSAYSPAAVDGNRVKAGEVLGFVGNTGDAEGTPYHLHFEVHPVGYLALGYDGAVDPTPYLRAWQHQKDLRFAYAAGWAPQGSSSAPQAGAILLQSSDISTANGLEPGSLARALKVAATEGVAGILGSGLRPQRGRVVEL